MEIDFNKFKKKEYPKYLEDYYTRVKLNKDILSETNLKYSYDEEKDILNLAQDKEILFKFKQKMSLPDDVHNSEDINQFLFNSQKNFSLDPNKGVVMIEGFEIPLDNLLLNSFGESGQFEYTIVPTKFDEKDFIKWRLKYNNKQKDVNLIRVPNSESAYTKKYEYNFPPLKITVCLKRSNETIISVSTQFQGETLVEQLLESLHIQIAFLEKEIEINDVPLSQIDSNRQVGNQEKVVRIKENFNFWKKVFLLQKKFNVKFNVKFPLDEETLQTLEKLIISFVLDEVYRETYKINTINLKFNSNQEMYNNVETIKSTKYPSIHWKETHNLSILGITIKISQYFGVSNYQVKSIIPNEETMSVKLNIKEKDDKKMVVVSKFVLENETIENVLKTKIPDYWLEFRDRIKTSE